MMLVVGVVFFLSIGSISRNGNAQEKLVTAGNTGSEQIEAQKKQADVKASAEAVIKKAKNDIEVANKLKAGETNKTVYNRAKGYLATAESLFESKQYERAEEFASKATYDLLLIVQLPLDAKKSLDNAMSALTTAKTDENIGKYYSALLDTSDKNIVIAQKAFYENDFSTTKALADSINKSITDAKATIDNANNSVEQARTEVYNVRDMDGSIYMPDLYNKAYTALRDARTAFYSDKKLDIAIKKAGEAISLAKQVMQGIESAKKSLEVEVPKLIDDATKMIDSAKQVSAGKYCPDLLKSIETSYASAKTLVTEKNFAKAKEIANKVITDAKLAKETSEKKGAEESLAKLLEEVKNAIVSAKKLNAEKLCPDELKAAEDSLSLASDIMKSDILKAKEIADKANIDAKAVLEKVKKLAPKSKTTSSTKSKK